MVWSGQWPCIAIMRSGHGTHRRLVLFTALWATIVGRRGQQACNSMALVRHQRLRPHWPHGHSCCCRQLSRRPVKLPLVANDAHLGLRPCVFRGWTSQRCVPIPQILSRAPLQGTAVNRKPPMLLLGEVLGQLMGHIGWPASHFSNLGLGHLWLVITARFPLAAPRSLSFQQWRPLWVWMPGCGACQSASEELADVAAKASTGSAALAAWSSAPHRPTPTSL